MLIRFGKDYFQSPFFIWSIIILILTSLYANKTLNQILQSLLIDNLYLPIFIITQSTAIVIAIYPIKKGLKDFFKTHDRKTRLVYELLILLTFLMFVPVFLIDQRMIIGILWQSAIADRNQFNFAMQAYVVYQFVGLPLIQFYNFHILKSRLRKEGYETEDKLRNNLKSIFYTIFVCIGIVILSGFVTSFLN